MVGSIKKKKRVRLTIGEKADMAQLVKTGHSASQLMRLYKVSIRTVHNIKQNCDDIIKQATESGLSRQTKTIRAKPFAKSENKASNRDTNANGTKNVDANKSNDGVDSPATRRTLPPHKEVMDLLNTLENIAVDNHIEALSGIHSARRAFQVAYHADAHNKAQQTITADVSTQPAKQ